MVARGLKEAGERHVAPEALCEGALCEGARVGEVSSEEGVSRRVVIALGANVGDAAATLRAATERIGRIPGLTVVRVSPFYRSEPAYLDDQAEFCNAVLLAEFDATATQRDGSFVSIVPSCATQSDGSPVSATPAPPDSVPLLLLRELQAVEREFGRMRTVPNGPRTLDVDIIDFEGVVSTDPELLLPHPRALERDFVVTPLLAVAPGYVLADGTPVTRETIAYGRVLGVVDETAGSDGRIAVTSAERPKGDPAKRGTKVPSPLSPLSEGVPDGRTKSAPDRRVEDAPGKRTKDAPAERPEGAPGILSLCATPIGNLGDLTLRVIETLEAADLILAEDTRIARRLLSHLGIRASVERCDENTIRQRSARVVERVAQGWRVAYVSDAGTPTVADPGSHLVAAVRRAGLPVEVLPGPSAVLTALVASGLTGQAFYFGGFLPRKHARIIAILEALAALDATLVFFESPRRAPAALAAIAKVFPGREVVLARELTKLHEEILCDNAPALARRIAAREQEGHPLKGEVVIVIAAPTRPGTRRIHRDKYKDG